MARMREIEGIRRKRLELATAENYFKNKKVFNTGDQEWENEETPQESQETHIQLDSISKQTDFFIDVKSGENEGNPEKMIETPGGGDYFKTSQCPIQMARI